LVSDLLKGEFDVLDVVIGNELCFNLLLKSENFKHSLFVEILGHKFFLRAQQRQKLQLQMTNLRRRKLI